MARPEREDEVEATSTHESLMGSYRSTTLSDRPSWLEPAPTVTCVCVWVCVCVCVQVCKCVSV